MKRLVAALLALLCASAAAYAGQKAVPKDGAHLSGATTPAPAAKSKKEQDRISGAKSAKPAPAAKKPAAK